MGLLNVITAALALAFWVVLNSGDVYHTFAGLGLGIGMFGFGYGAGTARWTR